MKKKLPWWRSPWVMWPAKTVGTVAVVGVLVLFGWFWWKGVPALYRNPDGTVDNTPVSTTRTGLLVSALDLGDPQAQGVRVASD